MLDTRGRVMDLPNAPEMPTCETAWPDIDAPTELPVVQRRRDKEYGDFSLWTLADGFAMLRGYQSWEDEFIETYYEI